MKRDQQKTNWLLDAALFGGFLLAMWLDFTGVAIHQWWGLGMGVLAVYHLMRHQSWVAAVTKRLLHGASSRTLRMVAADVGLLTGFATITSTGIVMSTWLDLTLTSYGAWRTVHVAASMVTGALIVAKIGMHWRWVVTVAQRTLVAAPRPSAGELASVPAHVGRRDFIRLMGIVGASTLLLGVNALRADEAESEVAAGVGEAASVAATAATASNNASASCTIRCGRRCSYPGHCRRYTDSNGNGRCDLGECSS